MTDYQAPKNKGYTDKEIKAIWARDAKTGRTAAKIRAEIPNLVAWLRK